MNFARAIIYICRRRIAGAVLSAVRPCALSSIDIWRFAKVACSCSPSLFLSFSLGLNTHVLSFSLCLNTHVLFFCPGLAPIFFYLILCLPPARRIRTRTYVRTFRHLTIVTRSIVHRRRHRREAARDFPTSRATRSATIFSAARYRRTWHWGSPEREREKERIATRR